MANLLYIDVLDKIPSELFDYFFDFVNEIPSGDSIKAPGGGSATGVAALDEAGADVSSTVVVSNTVTGTKIKARINALSTSNKTYLLIATAEMTTSGEKFKKYVLVHVGEQAVVQ